MSAEFTSALAAYRHARTLEQSQSWPSIAEEEAHQAERDAATSATDRALEIMVAARATGAGQLADKLTETAGFFEDLVKPELAAVIAEVVTHLKKELVQ